MTYRTTLMMLLLAAAGAGRAAAQRPGMGDSTRSAHHQAMMQEMRAADERLDRLVAEMNRASGNQKVPAMAKVLNELVAQRKQMRMHMMQMMDKMAPNQMMGGPRGPKPAPAAPDTTGHAQHHDST